jgi:hypothetical protein
MPHRNLDTVDKLSTDQHWQNFADFCHYDMLAGGPDSHMTLAGHMSKGLPLMERLWHAGVYVGVYNVPTAEILWTAFTHKEMLKISNQDLTAWLTDNWQGIATRTERKCVRVPANMAYYLKNYAEWILTLPNRYDGDADTGDANSHYEDMWEYSQKSVKFLGRYSCFKLLEYMTRYCNMPINLPDIRPVGGWSPRTMLSILYPEYKATLFGTDNPANLTRINMLADNALKTLQEAGLNLNMYKLEVFLCDYKQCYFGRRQYPGRSQDSEITYLKKLQGYWNYDFQMLKARSEIFPNWALGELNGWDSVRKDLGTVLYDYGYMWSDSLYDYKNTVDLSIPTGKFCNV